DLHVVEPGGFEIYYQPSNRTSPSGGTLDLDSNAGCTIDNINNENVTWPAGRAPNGNYIVRVDNWNSCGQQPINWVVTVQLTKRQPQKFMGPCTDGGDRGGAGAGTTVTTFMAP